jgi:hypothetical protein
MRAFAQIPSVRRSGFSRDALDFPVAAAQAAMLSAGAASTAMPSTSLWERRKPRCFPQEQLQPRCIRQPPRPDARRMKTRLIAVGERMPASLEPSPSRLRPEPVEGGGLGGDGVASTLARLHISGA